MTANRPGPTIQKDSIEMLQLEVADAWFEYLEATRGQDRARYEEVESWAWKQLDQRLHTIKMRRNKLRT